MSVKRFEWTGSDLEKRDDGDFVLYEDYEAVLTALLEMVRCSCDYAHGYYYTDSRAVRDALRLLASNGLVEIYSDNEECGEVYAHDVGMEAQA